MADALPQQRVLSPSRRNASPSSSAAASSSSPPAADRSDDAASLAGSPTRNRVAGASGPRKRSSDADRSHPSHSLANPPDLADFAAAAASAEAARRRPRGFSNAAEEEFALDDTHMLALKRLPSLQRQPSAPHMIRWDSEESRDRDRMRSPPRDQPFAASADGVRISDLTAVSNFTLEDAVDAHSLPQSGSLTWSGPPPSFDHLKQRPSSDLFGRGAVGGGSTGTGTSPPTLTQPLLGDSPPPSAESALERDLIAQRHVELADHNKGLGRRQLRAMLKKNWILKKRHPTQFLCEIISPLLMVLVIVLGWVLSLKHVNHYPDQTYANDTAIVQEVFDWVIQHVEKIPTNEAAYEVLVREEQQRSITSRFAHRRAGEPGFIGSSGDGLQAAAAADDDDPRFMESLSPFSALLRDGYDFSSSPVNVAAPSLFSPDPNPPPSNSTTCFPITALPGEQFCYDRNDAHIVEQMLSYNGPTHVPGFDEFVTAHFVLQYLLHNGTDSNAAFGNLDQNIDRLDQFTNGRLANLIFLGKLIFCPDVPAVHQLVAQLSEAHQLFQHVFTGVARDEDAALQLSLQNVHTDEDRTWAILVFNELDIESGRIDYSIRMNSSVLPTTLSILDQFVTGLDEDYKKYYYSGFLTLQVMMENLIFNISSGGDGDASRSDSSLGSVPTNPSFLTSQTVMGVPFPTHRYSGNGFYHTVGPLVGLVFCMSMLYPTSRLIKGIVEEKETKTKETMKMMGLKDWVFHCSWFLTFFLQFIVTASGLVILLHFTLLPHTSPSLLFAFFICFLMSEIAFGFLITVFFSRAKLAGILGPIILFAATMPRYAFFSKDAAAESSEATLFAKTICSFFSPTAFTFGADLIIQYEGANLDLGWSNLYDDPFSMARVMAFLLLDFAIYALLAWYLDHVMPNEYGQRLSPLFCCRRSFWRNQAATDYVDESDDDGDDETAVIEPVDESMHARARVHIKKLRKQFTEGRGKSARTTTAVNGLDLTLYEGQITALLGHNGAGKSTSISMLTGLISPTSGDCSVHGFSIRKNMKEIRKSLGICPQQNVLFGRLSVAEHLELYATLKGVKTDDVAEEVQKKIDEVGLTEKRDIYSSALSGGMQRKLQCAMAFIGGSKVVFLDEPTSGMDPYSRRSTWELLRNAKQGRVIVLTTHFMDEADLLGDRIAIMSEGKLRCCGSSLFLKSTYGIGYNLTLVKASKQCRTEQVSKMVMFFCPDAKVLSTAGGEMSYRLPWSSVAQFPGLFAQLEERRHHMGIGGYGISQTTLEEVFMRCAQIGESGDSTGDVDDADGHHPFAALEEERRRRLSGASRGGSLAGSRKASANNTSPLRESSSHIMSGSVNGYLPLTVDAASLSPDELVDETPKVRLRATLRGQFIASFQKRYICALRDLMGRFFEIVLPVIVVALVLLILKLNAPQDGADLMFTSDLYAVKGAEAPMWYTRESADRLEPATLYSFETEPGISTPMFDMIGQPLTDSIQMSDALLNTFKSHAAHRYGALLFNDSIYTHFNLSVYDADIIFVEHPPLTVMHNTTFFHSLPVMLTEVAKARWNANRWRQAAEPTDKSRVTYHLHNHPLPLTSNESLRTRTYLSLFAALFILIPFCYLPASFVLFVVKERSVKSKHQQFVSGLNPNIYWLATYAWDIVNYAFVALSVVIVMLAFQNQQLTGTFASFSATLLLFLLYGLAAIPLSYCYSFAFGNYTSAQVGIAGLNFVTGFVLVIASFMLDNIASAESANAGLKVVYRCFPTFTLGEGLINLVTRDFFALLHGRPKPNPFDWPVVGRSLTYLVCEAIAFMVFALLLESNFMSRMVRNLFNLSGELADPGPELVEAEDEDVAKERARVQRLQVRVHKDANGNAHGPFHSPVTPGVAFDAHPAGVISSTWSLNSAEGHSPAVFSSPQPIQPASRAASSRSGSRTGSRATSRRTSLADGPTVQLIGSLRAPLLGNEEREAVQHEEAQASFAHAQLDEFGVRKSAAGELPPDLPPLERGESVETISPLPIFGDAYPRVANTTDGATDESDVEEQEDVLVMQHLRKVYPARGGGRVTTAVQNLSLGIPRGQVFGFLGINGAGKTTSMKMLSGDIPITKGRAFINGFSVAKQLTDVRKEIGYCPQTDPLLPDLTARETLTMYARIHGLPSDEIAPTVQRLLDTLGLAKFADKQCGPYSGGNKRKLSLAISLIGDPSVVFLDEPSTGMDPVSRRFMWSVIESLSDGRSVVLTTHSMEECEALCGRIGIMVAGALQCLGSVQHLKSRFGSAYLMELNVSESRVKQVQAFIAKSYPDSTLDEVHAGRLKYRLPQSGISLSSVFSAMEARKQQLGIRDYSISQCSLESIFISRVREQKEHEAEQA